MTSSEEVQPTAEAEVYRLDDSAQPTAYELFFDCEPHFALLRGLSPEVFAPYEAHSPVGASSTSGSNRKPPRSGPPLRDTTFNGHAKIHAVARTNLRNITLHALDLRVHAIAWAVRSDAEDFDAYRPPPSVPSHNSGDASPDAAAEVAPTSPCHNTHSRSDMSPPHTNSPDACEGVPPLLTFAALQTNAPDHAKLVESWKHDPSTETLRFDLGETIAENRQIVIYISYSGAIRHTSQGLFVANKEDPLQLATHLEATNARRLYPCFDEPRFQARFRVSVRVPELHRFVLLGNTDIAETTCDGGTPQKSSGLERTPHNRPSTTAGFQKVGSASSFDELRDSPTSTTGGGPGASGGPSALRWQTTTFEATPPIASYLVAFTFAPLHCVEAETKSGIVTRVFLPLSKPLESAMFALDMVKKAVEFFEGFFDYKLPARKLDVVSIPNLSILGMENWGLLLILDGYVAVSEATPLQRRQRIARLVGHEVAHQWFGNLVGLSWWRFLWLKEGLARFLEYVFTSAVFPKWEMWMHFMLDSVNHALIADAEAVGRHPIEMTVGLQPREIGVFFDAISYEKAAAVMRMACYGLGGDGPTSVALRQFVHRHAASAATSDALYACFSDAVAKAPAGGETFPTGRDAPTTERLLQSWVTTAGPAYVYVRPAHGAHSTQQQHQQQQHNHQHKQPSSSSRSLADDDVDSASSKRASLVVRSFSCPDLSRGFSSALRDRAKTPREEGSEPGDPLLDGRSRRAKAHRPSSMLISMPSLLEPFDVPVPVHCTAYTGAGTTLYSGFVGYCKGSDEHIDVPIEAPAPEGDPASPTSPSAGSSNPQNGSPRNGSGNGTPPSWHGGGGLTLSVNALMHAPCRVDYESSMWWRIVESVMHRPAKERLAVAVALFEQKGTLVGVTAASDPIDRCNLLMRFLAELGTHREQHAVVWAYVSAELQKLITLLQDHPCWIEVRLLILYAHRELLGSKKVSLFNLPPDPVLEYTASHELTVQQRLIVLRTLARCGHPDVVAEAVTFTEWVLAAIGATPAPPATGGGLVGGASYSEPTTNPLGGDVGSGGLIAAPREELSFDSPPSLADSPCDVDTLNLELVGLAFEAAVAGGGTPRLWIAVVHLFAAMVREAHSTALDMATLTPSGMEHFAVEPKQLTRMTTRSDEWINALLPAVLACPLQEARPIQMHVLTMFSGLATGALIALFSNSNLLTKFLEERCGGPRTASMEGMMRCILNFAESSSANALVASWFAQNDMAHEALFDNCTWADYVNEHYTWYVKRHLYHQVAPQDAVADNSAKSLTINSAVGLGGDPTPDSLRRCSV